MCTRSCKYLEGAHSGTPPEDRICSYCRHPGHLTRTRTLMDRLREETGRQVTTADPELQELLKGENCPLYEEGEPCHSEPVLLERREHAVYTDGKRNRAKTKPVYIPPAPQAKLMELYDRGMTDGQIAGELGITVSRVLRWRKENRLIAAVKKDLPQVDQERLRKLYDQGMNDQQIERETGISSYRVALWRKKNELAPQIFARYDRDRARELWKQGKTDREIAEAVGVNPVTINKWRERNGLPAGSKVRKNERELEMERLYWLGKTDAEIAEASGSTLRSVTDWRHRSHLPMNEGE